MKNTLLTISFILYTIIASATPFITRWDLSKTGSGANQISFNAVTTGAVNYTWETVPLSSNNGSGTFTNWITTITGLPTNAIIKVKIDNANFNSFAIGSSDNQRLVDVEQWGTVSWTSMNNAFDGCLNLKISATDIPNLSNVSDISNMFASCSTLNGPNNINIWNTSNVTNMSGMFLNATSFNQPIGNWNTSNVTDMSYFFESATSFNQPLGNWNTSKVINMAGMFYNAKSFNQPIGNWNTSNVNAMGFMFSRAATFNQPLGNWNTSIVWEMRSMFSQAATFNQPLGNWNMSNVIEAVAMFDSATSFNQPISNWNMSNVENISNMFAYATSFNQPIGNWNTSKVTNMGGMFYSATSFNQPLGNWNTSNVYNIGDMFAYATSFNQPLGNWNTSNVVHINAIFQFATSFNQPLGNWNLSKVEDMYHVLDSSGMDCHNYTTTLQGWANNTATPNFIAFSAINIHYGTNAIADRNTLITTKNWDIFGDIADATACYPTGINSTTPNNQFTFSPNPTQGTLNINSTQAGTFTLYNMLGQAVYSTTLIGNNTKETKTLPSLAPSIYNYILTSQNGERVVGKLEME